MTHVGPYNSSTTVIKNNNNKNEHVYSGCEFYDKILQEYSE